MRQACLMGRFRAGREAKEGDGAVAGARSSLALKSADAAGAALPCQTKPIRPRRYEEGSTLWDKSYDKLDA